MAAMIWDEQAQAFTEAETPMKYDQTAGTWTNTTGLAWDNDAQAWTERWNNGVSAYVYGAASETITIRKDGIVVATVQTDASGCSTEKICLFSGTYDMTGSVSGWTEEQTVDKHTTKFRAMTEGAIYWYGNECTDVTGGWLRNAIEYIIPWSGKNDYNDFNAAIKYDTYMLCGKESVGYQFTASGTFVTKNILDLSKYTSLEANIIRLEGSMINKIKAVNDFPHQDSINGEVSNLGTYTRSLEGLSNGRVFMTSGSGTYGQILATNKIILK